MFKFIQKISNSDDKYIDIIDGEINLQDNRIIKRCYDYENDSFKISNKKNVNTIDNIEFQASVMADNKYYIISSDKNIDSYDFPEYKSADKHIVTNDGLLIFFYSTFSGYTPMFHVVVYDLLFDNKINFESISDDITNHVNLIKYRKYTNPRVRNIKLYTTDIGYKAIVLDIKYKSTINNKQYIHFFVDIDLDISYRVNDNTITNYSNEEQNEEQPELYNPESYQYGIDEYGFYVTSADNPSIKNNLLMRNVRLSKKSKIVVSTEPFTIFDIQSKSEEIDGVSYYYYILPDNTTFAMTFNTKYGINTTKTISICC